MFRGMTATGCAIPAGGTGKSRGEWIRIPVVVLLALAAAAGPLALGAARPWLVSPLLAGLGLAFGIWGVSLSVKKVPLRWIPEVHLPLLVVLVYLLVRYRLAPVEYTARMAVMTGTAGVLAFWLGSAWLDRRWCLRLFVVLWAVLGIGISVYGLWQAVTETDLVYWIHRAEQYRGRASGTYINANHLAGWIEMVLPWIFAGTLAGGLAWYARIPGLLVSALMGTAHLFTFSRGGWLAASGELVGFAWWRSRPGWRRRLAVGGVVLLIAAAAAVLILASGSIRERFLESRPGSDTSFRMRVHMWRSAWTMFRGNPWFGIGPGMYEWAFVNHRVRGYQFWTPYAHNDYLQALAEHGIVGVLLFLLAAAGTGVVLLRAKRSARDESEKGAAVAVRVVLVGLAIHSLVDFNLHIPANTITFGICLGLACARGRSLRRVFARPARLAFVVASLLLAVGTGAAAVKTVAGAEWFRRAGVHEKAYELEQAADCVRRALRWDPNNFYAWERLGDLLSRIAFWNLQVKSDPERRRRMFDEAVDAYWRAHRLCPEHPIFEQKIAEVMKRTGRYEEAEAIYRELIEKHPTDPISYDLYGKLLYYQLGREEEAVAAFRKALENLPGDEMALRELRRIRELRKRKR